MSPLVSSLSSSNFSKGSFKGVSFIQHHCFWSWVSSKELHDALLNVCMWLSVRIWFRQGLGRLSCVISYFQYYFNIYAVLVSYCCYKKLSHTYRLKATKMYYLVFLVVRNPKRVLWDKSRSASTACSFWRFLGKNPLPRLLQRLQAVLTPGHGVLHHTAFCPLIAVHFTYPSFLCSNLPSSLLLAHLGLPLGPAWVPIQDNLLISKCLT